jgi:hypothetical protein
MIRGTLRTARREMRIEVVKVRDDRQLSRSLPPLHTQLHELRED